MYMELSSLRPIAPRTRRQPLAHTSRIARGLEGITLTETRLSKVVGEAGTLLVGGFPVEELARLSDWDPAAELRWWRT